MNMRFRIKYCLPFLLAAFGVVMPVFAASVRLGVSPSRGRQNIDNGDLFYITYEVSDIDAAPERPASVPGARVMYFERTGQSSRFSSVNGKTSQSFSYTYTMTLRAQKEGSYTFGPVTVGGVRSNAVSYSIGKADPGRNQGNPAAGASGRQGAQPGSRQDPDKPKFIGKGDGNLYLRSNVSKTTAYEQEALVYTVKLYTTYEAIKFIGATAAPKFEGFVVEESKDISQSLTYETVGGKTYATAVIARYIIFPQMDGKLKVKGNTYTVSVDEREYYHDPFFGRMSVSKPLQLNVTPNDLEVNVKPLPSPKPADFCGGVGSFKLTSSLPSQKFLSNQAASIVYTVSGTGNLKYVTLPDLNALYPKELEVYTANPETNVTVGRDNVSGTSRYDYSFMPLEPGTYEIPDVTLVYFNPQTGRYEKTSAKGYRINVGQGSGSQKSQTLAKFAFNSDLLPVVKPLRLDHRPYIYGFAYWLFFIIPVVLLGAGVLYYRNYLKANADRLAVMSRKAGSMARKRLKRAYACMSKDDSDHFYDEMLHALWGYLGEKLKMPTSSLSRENVKSMLEQHDIDKDMVTSLIALVDECEFAKYSPVAARSSMRQIYDNGVEVINNLEEAFKTSSSKKTQK